MWAKSSTKGSMPFIYNCPWQPKSLEPPPPCPHIMNMKIIAFLLLVACLPCCFGQTDTNLLASGDWSDVVKDGDGYALRGRLLVYDEHTAPNHARIYMEL